MMFSRIKSRENPSRRIRRIRIEGNCGSGYVDMIFRNSLSQGKRLFNSPPTGSELFSLLTLRLAGGLHPPLLLP